MEEKDMLNSDDLVESHETRIHQHEKRLNKHDERLNEVKEEIQQLKDGDKNKHERLLIVEENYNRLERTVAKENEETRTTMREQTKELFKIVERAMGFRETRSTQSHELKMARLKTWSTTFVKISLGLAGSGGVIYLIIEKIFLE